MLLAWIVLFSVIGSIGALAGAALMLSFPDRLRDSLLPALLGYATGTLLGAAFLGMIPTALAGQTPIAISSAVLAGIVAFSSSKSSSFGAMRTIRMPIQRLRPAH